MAGMSMTVGSLFSGIGGLELGFERAGFTVAWQVEIDEYCRKVLAKHWPDVPRYEDIRTVGAHNLAPVDVLVGGFPCQDISNAGKRAGIEGERSGLWREYARLVRELRPRYVVVENVSALLHRGIDTVLGELAESGYDAEWQVLPAAAFGAPHLRERIFIVAYSPSVRREENAVVFPQSAKPQMGARAWNRAWVDKPAIERVVNGLPYQLDRLRALGNAVVPQVAQYVAECVRAHAEAQERGRRA
jgi:DNA (cytosine-5)-methyltransferase 1